VREERNCVEVGGKLHSGIRTDDRAVFIASHGRSMGLISVAAPGNGSP
jgi:hypothetical protein